jgi:putative methyltransferase (TIGR04325 family)
MKTLLRKGISRVPGLRHVVARSLFLGPNHNTHRFWGVFPTYAAAKANVPKKFNQGFDAPDLENFSDTPQDRDHDTIRILASLLPGARRLFDLGGNVGLIFYQYRSALTYPADFLWTVCDVPYVNEEGEKLAAKRGETQLAFTNDRTEASGADIYMTNGALQYFEQSFASILAELKDKPRHVLVNRIPLTETEPFFTLQHMGYSVVPYHISNLKQFTSGIEALGYRLAESWKNDRFCDILLRPDRRVPHYYGFHFVRTNG